MSHRSRNQRKGNGSSNKVIAPTYEIVSYAVKPSSTTTTTTTMGGSSLLAGSIPTRYKGGHTIHGQSNHVPSNGINASLPRRGLGRWDDQTGQSKSQKTNHSKRRKKANGRVKSKLNVSLGSAQDHVPDLGASMSSERHVFSPPPQASSLLNGSYGQKTRVSTGVSNRREFQFSGKRSKVGGKIAVGLRQGDAKNKGGGGRKKEKGKAPVVTKMAHGSLGSQQIAASKVPSKMEMKRGNMISENSMAMMESTNHDLRLKLVKQMEEEEDKLALSMADQLRRGLHRDVSRRLSSHEGQKEGQEQIDERKEESSVSSSSSSSSSSMVLQTNTSKELTSSGSRKFQALDLTEGELPEWMTDAAVAQRYENILDVFRTSIVQHTEAGRMPKQFQSIGMDEQGNTSVEEFTRVLSNVSEFKTFNVNQEELAHVALYAFKGKDKMNVNQFVTDLFDAHEQRRLNRPLAPRFAKRTKEKKNMFPGLKTVESKALQQENQRKDKQLANTEEGRLLGAFAHRLDLHSKRLYQTFKRLDGNFDGFVSAKEFQKAFENLNLHPSERVIDVVLEDMDSNHDGYVDYNEFMNRFPSWLKLRELPKRAKTPPGAKLSTFSEKIRKQRQSEPALDELIDYTRYQFERKDKNPRHVFHNVDVNNDGFISRPEFMNALNNFGLDSDRTEKMFEFLDYNGDGYIDVNEFVGYFASKEEVGLLPMFDGPKDYGLLDMKDETEEKTKSVEQDDTQRMNVMWSQGVQDSQGMSNNRKEDDNSSQKRLNKNKKKATLRSIESKRRRNQSQIKLGTQNVQVVRYYGRNGGRFAKQMYPETSGVVKPVRGTAFDIDSREQWKTTTRNNTEVVSNLDRVNKQQRLQKLREQKMGTQKRVQHFLEQQEEERSRKSLRSLQ